MIKISVVLLATLVFILHARSASSAETLTEQLANAHKLIDSGKMKPAALELKRLIRENPHNAEAHMLLGAALASMVENENYTEAITREETAIRLDPGSASARRILGMIYANQQKFDQSLALLNEASRLKPTSFAIQRDLGSASFAAGKLDESIEALKKASALKPENSAVHSKLATIYTKQKKYPDAIREATEAVKFAGKHAESHLQLANIKLESGDSSGSIEPFKAAIAANGFDSFGCKNPMTAASAFSGLGWALASTDKIVSSQILQEALNYQKKAIKAFPSFPDAYIRTAELLNRQGKSKEAEQLFQRTFRVSHKNATIGIAYSTFLRKTGRADEACTVLKAVLENSPGHKQATEELAALESRTIH